MIQERDDECLDGGSEQEEAKGIERERWDQESLRN